MHMNHSIKVTSNYYKKDNLPFTNSKFMISLQLGASLDAFELAVDGRKKKELGGSPRLFGGTPNL